MPLGNLHENMPRDKSTHYCDKRHHSQLHRRTEHVIRVGAERRQRCCPLVNINLAAENVTLTAFTIS